MTSFPSGISFHGQLMNSDQETIFPYNSGKCLFRYHHYLIPCSLGFGKHNYDEAWHHKHEDKINPILRESKKLYSHDWIHTHRTLWIAYFPNQPIAHFSKQARTSNHSRSIFSRLQLNLEVNTNITNEPIMIEEILNYIFLTSLK